MAQLKDTFNREKDLEDAGVSGKVRRLKLMLEIVDPQLYNHFDKYKVEFSTFAYRWFILFFSQEFLMIDILRLWDYIFAPEDKFENCYFVSLAVLLIKKDELLVSDLTGILSNLKSLKGLNVEEIIGISKKIKTEFGKQCLKIINNTYE